MASDGRMPCPDCGSTRLHTAHHRNQIMDRDNPGQFKWGPLIPGRYSWYQKKMRRASR